MNHSLEEHQHSAIIDLRHLREAQGMSSQEVASRLNLNIKFINHLEEGSIADLDLPLAYWRGYLRAYGKLLHLSAQDIEVLLAQIAPLSNDKSQVANMPETEPALLLDGSQLLDSSMMALRNKVYELMRGHDYKPLIWWILGGGVVLVVLVLFSKHEYHTHSLQRQPSNQVIVHDSGLVKPAPISQIDAGDAVVPMRRLSHGGSAINLSNDDKAKEHLSNESLDSNKIDSNAPEATKTESRTESRMGAGEQSRH